MKLGGRDIDEILVNHCIEHFKEETNIDLTDDKNARHRLTLECER